MASRSMSERSQVAMASEGVFTIGSWMLNEVLSSTGTPVAAPNAVIRR